MAAYKYYCEFGERKLTVQIEIYLHIDTEIDTVR